MTVLAAAQPPHLQLAKSESPHAPPLLFINARPELAEVDVEILAATPEKAAHPQVRVTVAYLR